MVLFLRLKVLPSPCMSLGYDPVGGGGDTDIKYSSSRSHAAVKSCIPLLSLNGSRVSFLRDLRTKYIKHP